MARTFELEIATPERSLARAQAVDAEIPAREGAIGVLPDHAPLLSELGTGVMTYSDAGGKHAMAVSGGFLEIRDNHVRVLADRAERAAEIDIARAERALKRAMERMARPTVEINPARALAAALRAEARLAAAKQRS